MKALVHIGFYKAGSTFLQDVLLNQRGTLLAKGILYPRTFFGYNQHLGLCAAFKAYDAAQVFRVVGVRSAAERDGYRERVIETLHALAGRNAHTVLFSSEHLALLSEDQVKDFLAIMQSIFDEVDICLFVRRQDDLALSFYSEAVRSGSAAAFKIPEPPLYDFAALTSMWERGLRGRLAVFNFRPESFRHQFFAWVGTPELADCESAQLHASLDADEIALIRAFNRMFPRHSTEQTDKLRGNLLAAIQARPKGRRLALTEDERRIIADRYAASNARVSSKYLGGEPIIPGLPA